MRLPGRHLGEIKNGVEDITSGAVREWAPAYEKYLFGETTDGTQLTVEVDTLPEYERYMLDTYPRALSLLKELCEAKQRGRP